MSDELLDVAVRAAGQAGGVLLRRFGRPAEGLETKSSATDPVSDADREAESVIVGLLGRERPDDGVVAEEGAASGSRTGLEWVVDPLDGTVNFLYGIPHWAVSVAVEDDRGPLAGVVHDPCRGETFTAVRGEGARLNGRPITCSGATDLRHALVATGFSYTPAVRMAQSDVLSHLIGRVRDVRRAGTASLDLAWTACGRLDGFYESGLQRWDVAAGRLLVDEAGGRTGSLPVPIDGDPGVVAACGGVFHALIDALSVALRPRG